ncbi:hypothetical protein GCM10010495_69370 [Kitasatospora herbaricolor]|uniref:PKD domain-containing protein n=1 Tax=Kitasatospora herbaricolor TaxID=68217 RepID=UPI0019CB67FE|nr:PKD domain-containing protein [Kitasatospora herbaricolor]MDQ0313350.1 PKD repeat protein [Kitasatospora herbaricolor]GGV41886.1 hypothetical protein GCM10010495_69370 [Kitasatospora herbaricolor]
MHARRIVGLATAGLITALGLPAPLAAADVIPNAGTDSISQLDLGAVGSQSALPAVTLSLDETWAPVGTTITALASARATLPAGLTYHFDFGDGTILQAGTASAEHIYTVPGDYDAKVTVADQAGAQVSSATVAVKATVADRLTPSLTATDVIPDSMNPLGHIAPLTVNVDSSATESSWPLTGSTVDFGDGSAPVHVDFPQYTRHTYSTPGDYTIRLTVTDKRGRTAQSSITHHAAYAPAGYLPVNPYRLLDTREVGVGLKGGDVRTVKIPLGTSRYPEITSGSISAVVLNLTATESREDTHLTVWPAGQPRPATSNVNVAAGSTASNLVTVPLGSNESVSIVVNSGRAQAVVDVVGYYQPNVGSRFAAVAPRRLMDTRAGTALTGDETRRVKVAGINGIPLDASAVTLNLTSTQASADTYFTLWSGDSDRPVTTSLNPSPGRDRANQVIVPVGADGTISLYNHVGSVHAVLDVFGYYGPGADSLYTPVRPVRLGDTRTDAAARPGPDSVTTVGGIPAGATGAALNVTATAASSTSFLTVWAHGEPRPGTSNLNTQPGTTVPNHVTAPVGQDGKVDIYNHEGSTHIVTDLFGYFSKP